ncbi:UDP-N-acetylmuramoyl-tripeptide--D-alanyl-D-alanine ligase [Shewanella inventionis]|uniref:UDP-N-acetylmuramoyl-tripeptide--D-alanyl-D-alanine ligase n=1 Tax=Shewanella inventionis TaxID=1738770 RepID=A0ABQ1JH59_9GAMM|nr:UDP-N-acetylmuramoyl-tripeptide--D-alanyl-D-alanine ligase [Shewanella inventionis]MCL1158564.1 UDP-N-acetylmuramoyl-tripeptide--D-alanyl-D-alanine ligase [Shewanella inventionis]GGB68865.1 UDP-N-acetylmuramoyl-tripeptide--D-alanyl-D-alanine ligase [Shewanella inventionis]
MISLSLTQITEHLQGALVGNDQMIAAVSTDSRKIDGQCLFVALKGERFDGHDFASTAIENGAVALLVDHVLPFDVAQIVVADTQKAMGRIGALVRQLVNPISIALTGSNGKTSVKEMVATILSQQHQVLFTAGNFNNEIGVPLTLLRLTEGDKYGVFELGANHSGEIDYTSSLVQPQVALVNNIGSAHLEGFGSLDGVAKAKSEIFNHLAKNGTAVINADDKYAPYMQQQSQGHNQLLFSRQEGVVADVKAIDINADQNGCYHFTLTFNNQHARVQLPLAGLHQVSNALAAASLCLALDIPLAYIAQGFALLKPVKGRMQPHNLGRILLIDDSYNANPSSVSAAINWLQQREGFRCLVLGDLGELGDNAAPLHASVGLQAKNAAIEGLFCCGQLSVHASEAFGSEHFSTQDTLIAALQQHLKEVEASITILVKGSRSAAMERVVDSLLNAYGRGELV